jgi:uncharacterized RDD family membrane protein YckC
MSSVDNDGRYAPPRAAVNDVPEATDGLVLGSRGQRLLAAVIDVMVSLAAFFLARAVTPWDPFAETRDYFSLSLRDPAMGFVLFLLLNGYLLATQGRTIGKRLIGLRIVRSDGSPVSFGRMIGLRYGVFSLLNVLPALGQLVGIVDSLCIFRASRRCLHDELADTVVIKA